MLTKAMLKLRDRLSWDECGIVEDNTKMFLGEDI